ncbi:serine hydrolase domain-containing protein [Enterococcus sp. LJL99]
MNQQKITETIQELIQTNTISGASWATIQEQQTIVHYEGNLGVVVPYNTQKLTKKNYYDLASLTKVIGTTTRILQLVDQGKLTFQTSIGEIVPEFIFLNATIGELLLHCSGLPADLPDKKLVTKEKIRQFLLKLPSEDAGKVIYSDLGFYLLGEGIRNIDQCTLAESFKKNLFLPLEMHKTTYHLTHKQNAVPTEITENRGTIQGIVQDSKAFQLADEIGSAGLFSTLTDLCRFSRGFLNNQIANGEPLFSQELFTKIQTTNFNGRTYGWEVKQNHNQETYLYHTGFTGTSIGLNFEKKEALILLTNRIHPDRKERGFIAKREALYHLYF